MFFKEKIDISVIRELVSAASAAPSGDNCQPFRFVWDGHTLNIHYLADRGLAHLNAANVASYLSLGAMLTNMDLKAWGLGYQVQPRKFFLESPDGVWAELEISKREAAGSPLAMFINERAVNRRPYFREPLPFSFKKELVEQIGEGSDVFMQMVEDKPNFDALASVLGKFDRLVFSHRGIHDDLFRWLRWSDKSVADSRDGMHVATLETNLMEKMSLRVLSWWPISRIFGALGLDALFALRASRLYARSGTFGLISVARFSPRLFVEAGQLWQKVWLLLTSRGYALQPLAGIPLLGIHLKFEKGVNLNAQHHLYMKWLLNQVKKVVPSFESRVPVMFFRMGRPKAPPSKKSVRFPVEQILEVRDA